MADTRSIDDDNYIQLKELPEATSVKDTDVVLIADGTTDEKKATIAKVKAHIMTSVDNKLNDYSTTEEMNSAIETEIEGASSTIAASLVDDTSSATDKVLSAQGSRGISNGAVCSSSANASAKTVTINGFVLETGAVIRILFTEANSAANPTINISYDGTNYTGAKSIKAVKAGTKIAPPVHSGKWRGATAYTDEMWQPYTTLELMYDGTDWVIMGNPELENWSNDTEGYIVKANGYIEQWSSYDRGSNTDGLTVFDFYYYVKTKSNPIVTTEARRTDGTLVNSLTVHGMTTLSTEQVTIRYNGFNSSQRYGIVYIIASGY